MATLGRLESDKMIYEGDRVDLVLCGLWQTNSRKMKEREVCLHRGAVISVPVTNDVPAKYVLIKNRRHTVGETLLELPAGTLEYAAATGKPGDKTEDPAEARGKGIDGGDGICGGTDCAVRVVLYLPGDTDGEDVCFCGEGPDGGRSGFGGQ